MRGSLGLGVLACLVVAPLALGDGAAEAPQGGPDNAPQKNEAKPSEPKSIAALQEALERNAREVQALKDQYAKDMAQQRQLIERLERNAQALEARLQQRAAPAIEAQGANNQETERLRKLTELQQKQIDVLERQTQLLAEQLKKQAPTVETLETKTATLEARSTLAARRDEELAQAQDALSEMQDSQRRYLPQLPSTLRELFLPTQPNATPLTVYSTLSTLYNVFPKQRGAGTVQFQEFTPFFLYQLNKRMLLSAEVSFTQAGAALGQAQLDMFLNNWLTADVGYFLAPIGFWSERLDPRWINKLPDIPLVMQQVIPDGLTITGLQLRGATYLFRSPVKMEYSAYATNGLGVPGMGQANDWYNLGGVVGTTSGVNPASAYGGRIGFWVPSRGINFGISEFVNAPYSHADGAVISIWQPYFNYRYRNWDARFEYGQNFEQTKPFIGNNIVRDGLYAQLAYRDFQSIRKHVQRLEYVARFSDARFHGIDPKQLTLSNFSPLNTAPVDRNQYTVGINYYFYPTSILKFAYEFNQEIHKNLNDNVFMVQFSTNF